jgi:hypothetical protein
VNGARSKAGSLNDIPTSVDEVNAHQLTDAKTTWFFEALGVY